MKISLIAAIGKNNELGKGNDLLWKFPADQKFFRETTSGHPIIMGRKTFESIGRILPNRRNIIITRDLNYKKEGAEVVHSLAEALELFKNSHEEVFIIGGGEIYKQSINIANKLYITEIEAENKGAEVFFPPIDPNKWHETWRGEHEPDKENAYKYAFIIYERK